MNELMGGKEHFSMQQLVDLMGQNMTIVNSMAKQVGDLSKDVDDVKTSVMEIKKDVANIKENEEVTTAQCKNIRRATSKRVYTLLNIPVKPSDRTLNDKVIMDKYSKLFFKRLYAEVSRQGHLRDPYETTPKKFYDEAMRDIEAWYPADGVDGLRKQADENALARKIASEQGYM